MTRELVLRICGVFVVVTVFRNCRMVKCQSEQTNTTNITSLQANSSSVNVSSTVIQTSSESPSSAEVTTIKNVQVMSDKATSSGQDITITALNTIVPARPVDVSCLPLNLMGQMDHLTQEEFTSKLTDSCRYDRLIKPVTPKPLVVDMQIDLTHIESADNQQMKSYILVQLGYKDSRLKYDTFSPNRGGIQGEEPLRDKIWVPHLTVRNERESALMGLDGKDVFIQIMPDGTVIYSYRMTLTFYCWMNLQKFPFDYQTCEVTWISWSYDATNLMLKWSNKDPVQIAQNLHLTEFVLDSFWTETKPVPASFSTGGLVGNYSALTFKFKLRREVGYYIMDYFLPSMFLVVTSWVTFWLQADASAPRAVLGTSTMLSFITLNGGLTKNLPKVSYIKASEIWFLGCSVFIFLSMAEFAFVNVIWRRKKDVEMKKPSGKYILRGAVTPSFARRQMRRTESFSSLFKTRSCSSLNSGNDVEKQNTQNNYLTVHTFPSIPTIKTNSNDELMDIEESVATIPVPENSTLDFTKPANNHGWTTMTPQEVANWIDRKSRIAFPVMFLLFNIFYWSFVYSL